ncbi:ankyrin repeat family A protein 2-like [Lytechinus variegatus]|uniref:ankyrin repeat family A protein 2-like n=1 Tax=Lytechinus variegatus TaxID=7654 RepID=UPI001BB2A86A|nr:ankyrin repeat family A protein 2-like [Lytechinus variegatus]
MDTNQTSTGGNMFARIPTNPSPIFQVTLSPVPTQQGTVLMQSPGPVAQVNPSSVPTQTVVNVIQSAGQIVQLNSSPIPTQKQTVVMQRHDQISQVNPSPVPTQRQAIVMQSPGPVAQIDPSPVPSQKRTIVMQSPSPIVQVNISPVPTQKGTVMMPVANATQNFSPTLPVQKQSNIPLQLSASSGIILATRRDGIPASSLQGAEKGRIPASVARRDLDATTPVHLSSEKGRMSALGVAMVSRKDVEPGEGHHEESRPNMSRLSSVLNSLSDQDQASMDLEVQSVMFPESRGLLPTVKRICPSRSSSSSKASSKSSYSPMRQSTSFTNTKRGNIQTTTPTFPIVDHSIHQLAAQGELALIAEKLETGTDIDETDPLGHTALSWACQHNQVDMVRFLLENNADPRKASLDGETSLAFSCSIGNADIVRMLLQRKAPVNVFDYNGGTPLVYAVYHNHPIIVKMLLDSGADMTQEMESGHTPLSLSMVMGHKQVQRVIEQHMLSLLQIT